VEPISPILKPMQLEKAKQTPKPQLRVEPKPELRNRASRASQRGRAGSLASSATAASRRSQSILSHTDDHAVDNDTSSRHVKQEVATPIGLDDAGDTTADELPRLLSRIEPRASIKRKRAPSIDDPSTPLMPPTQVLWTRAFPKISASALEAISGHKNASTFAAPVKERDAPGYKQLILRPQDLKSIRSAIIAGQRAATAAAPEDMNPSAASIWLPISEDIIPPKGIINYAQLEKELMRMFANAIMFNPDPSRGFGRKWQAATKGGAAEDVLGYEIDEDSVVKDTKAMFAEVEKTISSLRGAERRSEEERERDGSTVGRGEEDEIDELAVDEESHTGISGTAKRRRKG
jgi:hypothetical protein